MRKTAPIKKSSKKISAAADKSPPGWESAIPQKKGPSGKFRTGPRRIAIYFLKYLFKRPWNAEPWRASSLHISWTVSWTAS